MRSGNPVLTESTFENFGVVTDRMTLSGTVNKTVFLLLLTLTSSVWAWNQFLVSKDVESVIPYIWIGVIGGFIFSLVTIFYKKASPYTAPVYALLEGMAIGSISALYESKFPGIVIQAVGLTFGTLFCLLMAYKSGMIKATDNFKLGVVSATGAIAVLYLVDIGLMLMGHPIPFIHEAGSGGVLFSLFVVVIAALNLVLDFDFIERGVEKGSPKYMEWYAGFGLLVTLIWLYLEILRLLAKARKR